MMYPSSTVAARLDGAVDQLLGGASPAVAAANVDSSIRPLVEMAALVRAALPALPVSPGFEDRLAARLAGAVASRDALAWAVRHPGRLIVTGAVGSAVGVGVTAYAVWRSSRRGAPHRWLGR
jgi:hypothetical protein